MAKIELKQEEVRELLESMSAATESLANTVASIQKNLSYMKECPGIDADTTAQSLLRAHRCLRGVPERVARAATKWPQGMDKLNRKEREANFYLRNCPTCKRLDDGEVAINRLSGNDIPDYRDICKHYQKHKMSHKDDLEIILGKSELPQPGHQKYDCPKYKKRKEAK